MVLGAPPAQLATKVRMAHKASPVEWAHKATLATQALLDQLVLPDKKVLMVFSARLVIRVQPDTLVQLVTKEIRVSLE
jgi:hypothetical protein